MVPIKNAKNVTKLEINLRNLDHLIEPFRIGNYIYSSPSLVCNNNY